jgi:predicted permease
MKRDIRFAIRMLLKQPGFSLIAVLTLALGIGATSAVFCLIQGVLLTPPPYKKPQQLMLVPTARTEGQKPEDPRGWPAQQWMEWQREAKSFEGIAAYDWTFNFLIRNEGSKSMQGMAVTENYLPVMGLQPVLGRGFEESDIGTGPVKVILLGYEFWQRTFNGDPQIIGKTVRISRWDVPPTVIGVMSPGVRFMPSPGAAKEPNYNVNALVDFWIPVAPDPKYFKDPYWNLVARLRDGTSQQQGQGELAVLAAREAQSEKQFEGFTPQLQSLTDEMNQDGRRILLPLLGAAALVLLIGCGNAAALLLVRGLQRQQEYAVRSALGMGRIALLRQVSTESLLLALLGGAFGVGLAFGVVKLFRLIARYAIPRLDGVTAGCSGVGCGFRRGFSGAASVSTGSNGGIEEHGSEGHGGNRGTPVVARSHHGADGADVGAVGGCGASDSDNDQYCESPLGLQHGTHPNYECYRGAELFRVGQFSPARLGTGLGYSRRAIRSFCVGSAAYRQQLACDSGNRRAVPSDQGEREDCAAAARRHGGLFQADGRGNARWARVSFER